MVQFLEEVLAGKFVFLFLLTFTKIGKKIILCGAAFDLPANKQDNPALLNPNLLDFFNFPQLRLLFSGKCIFVTYND